MAGFVEVSHPRAALRASLLTLMAVAVAGCSADTTRFNENPFAARNAPAGDVTGSISRGPAAPVARVESRTLPQTQAAQPLPPPPRTNVARTTTGVSTGAPGMGSYRPPQTQPSAEVTGSIPHQTYPSQARPNVQTAAGTAVTVAPGETLAALSRRYHVSVAAIMRVNGITNPNSLQVGQRVIIPSRGGSFAAAPRPTAVASAPRTVPSAPSFAGFHVAGPGDTLSKIARRYRVSVSDLAKANRIPPYARIKMGERLVIPAHVSAAPRAPVVPPQRTAQAAPVQQAPKQVASIPPQPQHQANLATPAVELPASATKAATGTAIFRWPVRGRIVTAFGPKPNGQRNDGINIAVPEGTPIKAAEAGEVAYAGNELKGYGNLVLVRHKNGFVTAYAHASELLVKRGDKVKRGQVIAKAGQTGNIGSPQLHFEIRKGSKPVDPSPYLGA